MNGSRVLTSTQGLTVTSISAYVGAIDASPNNQFSLSIYSDASGAPSALVAQSAVGTLKASSWNTLAISARLNPNTAHWLFYNTNATRSSLNNLRYSTDPGLVGAYAPRPFGTWPSTYGTATLVATRYSLYVTGSP